MESTKKTEMPLHLAEATTIGVHRLVSSEVSTSKFLQFPDYIWNACQGTVIFIMKKYRKSKVKLIKEDFNTIDLEQGDLVVTFGLPSCRIVWMYNKRPLEEREILN